MTGPTGWAWEQMGEEDKQYWNRPSKDVFQFSYLLRGRNLNKVYDLGCGLGRNLLFLLEQGFDVWGSDASAAAVQEVNERLGSRGLSELVTQQDMVDLREPACAYDAVIAYNVIYHATRDEMIRVLGHVRHMLRPGGAFLTTFLATASPSQDEGELIAPQTVVKTDGPEKGIPHYYTRREELEELMLGFELHEIEYRREEYGKPRRISCHYIVTAFKTT